jgi:regulator of protease activity HflC (stomatin/prohibitin superfamily)
MIRENEWKATSGYLPLVLLLLGQSGAVIWLVQAFRSEDPISIVAGCLAGVVILILWFGLFMVNPNEARVLQLFGKYVATVRVAGLRYANPFYSKRKVSVRVRNFETNKLKVNDLNSNPIEIATVVVWRVVDTAEALFEVDNYVEYVHVQSEAALRAVTVHYPYDAHAEGEVSLSSHAAEISEKLKVELQERLKAAGVEVLEARISHLAYAPEIASAMLQRQQASAIVAARRKIVDGAVGMVEMALRELSEQKIVELDEERKAAMVSNLLVVLCSDRGAHPVINAGSLY